MLSAEHYALEHRAVQALLDIRQREVAYMTERFNSVGTQSALIAGLAITTLTALDPGVPANSQEPDVTLEGVRQVFWASSALCVACSLHCILNSTFVAVWGPGLALRGPTGSVSKAFNHMVRERVHVMAAFVLSIVFLLLQSVLCFFILDKKRGLTPSSATATIILTGGGILSALCLIRMSKRFFFSTDIAMGHSIDDDDDNDLDGGGGRMNRRSQGRQGVGRSLFSLVNGAAKDPDELVEDVLGSHCSPTERKDQSYLDMQNNTLQASLLPRSNGKKKISPDGGGGGGGGSVDGDGSTNKNVVMPLDVESSAAIVSRAKGDPRKRFFSCQGYLEKKGRLTGAWRKRYFRLHGTSLYSWDTQEEFESFLRMSREERKKAKPKTLSLRGFQVLVKSRAGAQRGSRSFRSGNHGSEFCFVLDALDDGTNRRNRVYRAESEEQLREWVESLVAASLIAQ